MQKKHYAAFSAIEIVTIIIVVMVILIGIMQGAKLIKAFKIHSAQSITTNSPAASIKGLVAWFETSLDTSFNSEVDNEKELNAVSTWYDNNPQSVKKYNASQLINGKKPIHIKNAINGIPILRFNGSSQYFEIPYSKDLNGEFSIFAVVRTISSATAYGTIISSRNDEYGTTHQGYMIYSTPASLYQLWIGNGATSWGALPPSVDIKKLNTVEILSATYNGATSKLYLNGTPSDPMTQTMSENTATNLRIGAGKNESSAPDYYYSGDIAELIIFNRALNNDDRKSIESYLGKKFNIKVN